VSGVAYRQSFSLTGTNLITVTGATTTHQTASTWGVNLGGDVAAFPWTHVGVGGGLLYNKGTIQIADPFTATTQDLDMSSVTCSSVHVFVSEAASNKHEPFGGVA
jgi:hypothetical protein